MLGRYILLDLINMYYLFAGEQGKSHLLLEI